VKIISLEHEKAAKIMIQLIAQGKLIKMPLAIVQ
jgi:hypothetical protein